MTRESSADLAEDDLRLLRDAWAGAAALEHEPPSRFADRFLWKALLIEGTIWGIAGYAIGALVEWRVHREDHHLEYHQVVTLGLVIAVAGFALLVGAGDPVHFEIGPDRWGIPWYRKIRVGNTTWTSPF